MKAQIEDSALSISSNIAEGYSRRSIKETLRFYEIALASSAENYSQLFTLFNAEQILEDDFNDYDAKLYEFENGLVKMNKSLINRMNSVQEWNIDYDMLPWKIREIVVNSRKDIHVWMSPVKTNVKI